MTDIVAFSGRLTETDFRRIHRLAQKGALPAGAMLFGLLTAYLAWQWGWSGLRADPVSAMALFGTLLLVLPFAVLVRHFRLARHWRRNLALRKPVRGSVSEEGVTWHVDDEVPLTLPWSALLRYRASESLVLVYQTTDRWMYFFRHYFADLAQWQHFCGTVSRNLPRW